MAKTIGFWYRKKYNLPPNDPRYLDLTAEEIQAEYWAHQYAENGVHDEVEDEDFDLEAELARNEAEAEAAANAGGDEQWETVNLEQ